ncbi:MFS transporter [Paraburkholderia sp. Ac-20347]|uniref:MFS transporter n=1 Tax=Paraburkholderia sp. Ac-20347 TaxID=2703892 RepID=UPI00197FDB57|nr:MFS transporter [Paraburkholderia sp. Ac-20347]MBN3811984.1 MFS transporter [Paraburkholderia sp. Ac-20347]
MTDNNSDIQATSAPEPAENDGKDQKKKEKCKFDDFVSLGWKALLAFGGLMLLAFFWQVQFLPEIKLADITAVLAAVAVSGVVLLLIFVASAVLPALGTYAAFKGQRQRAKSIILAAGSGGLAASALFVGSMADSSWWALLPGVAALFVFIWAWHFAKSEWQEQERETEKQAEQQEIKDMKSLDFFRSKAAPASTGSMVVFLDVAFTAFIFFVGLSFSAIFFTVSYRAQPVHAYSYAAFVVWMLLCFGYNIALATGDVRDKRRLKVAGALIFLLVVAFLMLTGSLPLLASSVVKKLGLGEIDSASILLTSQGCDVVEATSNNEMRCSREKAGKSGTLCDVKILSRIGSEVLLSDSHSDVVVKRDDVLGWQRSSVQKTGSARPAKCALVRAEPDTKSASEASATLSPTVVAAIQSTVQTAVTQANSVNIEPPRAQPQPKPHPQPRPQPPRAPGTSVTYANQGSVTVNNYVTSSSGSDASACDTHSPKRVCDVTPRANTKPSCTTSQDGTCTGEHALETGNAGG